MRWLRFRKRKKPRSLRNLYSNNRRRVIDMGPEGSDGGGTLVAEGTPEAVAKVKASHTGRYLGKVLRGESLMGGK